MQIINLISSIRTLRHWVRGELIGASSGCRGFDCGVGRVPVSMCAVPLAVCDEDRRELEWLSRALESPLESRLPTLKWTKHAKHIAKTRIARTTLDRAT